LLLSFILSKFPKNNLLKLVVLLTRNNYRVHDRAIGRGGGGLVEVEPSFSIDKEVVFIVTRLEILIKDRIKIRKDQILKSCEYILTMVVSKMTSPLEDSVLVSFSSLSTSASPIRTTCTFLPPNSQQKLTGTIS
jgi:hypothetical protein